MKFYSYGPKTSLTKLTFESVPPEPPKPLRIKNLQIGDVFMTKDNKVMMMVQMCDDPEDTEEVLRIYLLNLQTGKVWRPSPLKKEEVVYLVEAVVKVKELK